MTPARPHDFARFFLPGPTAVRPEVLDAQTEPMIGHRGPDMVALMEPVQAGLRTVFRTRRPVFVSTSSATGMMEAGIRNAAGARVLALVNGAFGARFADVAEACGVEVERMEVPWGEAHEPGPVAERLARGGVDAVTVVHSETSTGVLNPLPELARTVREAGDGALLLVDSVTGVGGAPVETDAWGLDYVLTGSQKALALPPGLAFAVASEAVLARSAEARGKGVYFDLAAFASNAGKMQTPNTPALSLLNALRLQLVRIEAEGVEARWKRHAAMAERCVRWVRDTAPETGIGLLAPEGRRSPTVTAVTLPAGVPGPEVVGRMRERGWVIGGGYGKLAETTIRIGHMGDHTPEELEPLLEELGDVLRDRSRERAS